MNTKITHLDLFSGIGGFALAVDEVFPGTEHIFCEIDHYCQALLKLRFPGSKIYGDIRRLGFNSNSNSNGQPSDTQINSNHERKQTLNDVKECGERFTSERCFILTGGFPCQPFSQAGKRRGTEDNRYLWPEMLRVIREFNPTWVIAENVRGLLTIEQGVVFEQVCLDLEGEGYEVQPFIFPAVAVNAPHRRDRVWFVGYSKSAGQSCGEERQGEVQYGGTSQSSPINAPDTYPTGQQNWNGERGWQSTPQGERECGSSRQGKFYGNWQQNWLEVATKLCGVDDGLPAELDGLKLSKARHRVERLKALGNAIVPQVAVEILKAIKHASR